MQVPGRYEVSGRIELGSGAAGNRPNIEVGNEKRYYDYRGVA